MRAGKLRHRVSVKTPNYVKDALGGETVTWSTLADVWASVTPVSGSDPFTAVQPTATITHKITMRKLSETTMAGAYFPNNYFPAHYFPQNYFPNEGDSGGVVAPKDRVYFGSRVFEIVYVRDIEERGIKSELLCEEKYL